VTTKVTLDKPTVERIAGLNSEEYDAKLFSPDFRGPILARRYLTLDELVKVAAWKSARPTRRVRTNAADVVEAVTRRALETDIPYLAAWILCYLDGVWARTASAILTLYDPEQYTVINIRAWAALERLGLLRRLGLSSFGGSDAVDLNDCRTYDAYLKACKALVADLGVPLRTLDRCLWTISGDDGARYGLASHGLTLDSARGALGGERPLGRGTPTGHRPIPDAASRAARGAAPPPKACRHELSVDRRRPEFFSGCLLGGAVGDALGASVEFMSLAEIRQAFGPNGIRDYRPAYGKLGAITDDTQMTMFTAEGLLRADNRYREKGICHPPAMVHHAYLRWLQTQGEHPGYPYPEARSGWLFQIPALSARRAPGNTCLSALVGGTMGTTDEPINDSKGCGGVMRVAPVGLAGRSSFNLGCDVAAITHGHPSGFLAAGFFAAVIDGVVMGESLEQAIAAATDDLRARPDHEECLHAVEAAVRLARQGPPTPESVETLGGGWVAEEALAIALFCSLTARDFADGVILAVKHGGDSDSTGAMTGNILGALGGKDAIPVRWLDPLELRHEIEEVAVDLFRHFGTRDGGRDDSSDWDKYSAW
jgi:ADP-ribosylglycohydrolase